MTTGVFQGWNASRRKQAGWRTPRSKPTTVRRSCRASRSPRAKLHLELGQGHQAGPKAREAAEDRRDENASAADARFPAANLRRRDDALLPIDHGRILAVAARRCLTPRATRAWRDRSRP